MSGRHGLEERGAGWGVGDVESAERTVRQIFAAYEDTVQVAFRAAVSDVAPVLVVLNLPQLGEPIQHPDLRNITCKHGSGEQHTVTCIRGGRSKGLLNYDRFDHITAVSAWCNDGSSDGLI